MSRPTEVRDAWRCPNCGLTMQVKAFPIRCACGFAQYRNPPGLGDRVAAALARVGITEQRYRLAKQAIGLKPDCDCKKRQRLLNQLGGGRARHDDPA